MKKTKMIIAIVKYSEQLNQARLTKKSLKKTMVVVGDSTVKNIFGSADSNNKNRVFVKSFSGEKGKCRKSYIISTAELQPKIIILHSGTNKLR